MLPDSPSGVQVASGQVPAEFIEKYLCSIHESGDVEIRADIARAKTVLSFLDNSMAAFFALPCSGRAALNQTRFEMASLVDQLQSLLPWAVVEKSKFNQTKASEFVLINESNLSARWCSDSSAIAREDCFLNELRFATGLNKFAVWLHGLGQFIQIPVGNFFFETSDNRAVENGYKNPSLAAQLMAVIDGLPPFSVVQADCSVPGKNFFLIGRDYYEKYLSSQPPLIALKI